MFRFAAVSLMAFVFIGGVLAAEEEIPVYGNWDGGFTGADWKEKPLRAQIVGESWETYRAILYVGTGGGEERAFEFKGKTRKDGPTEFAGKANLGSGLGGLYDVGGTVSKGVFKGALEQGSKRIPFELQRVILEPPTLGMKPPAGAVVLFDGTPKALDANWNVRKRWQVQSDGSMQIVGSSLISKKEFGSGHYHIEFRTPYMPGSRGQGRGNSGVYIQGRYEIQVLDSFTDAPKDNRCGGIYQLAVPVTNACLPPMEWQTYDITFTAPQFDASGKKTKNGMLHVVHNGTVIHDHLDLPHLCPGGVSDKEAPVGVLMLQDHSDRVGFRNVWVKPLD